MNPDNFETQEEYEVYVEASSRASDHLYQTEFSEEILDLQNLLSDCSIKIPYLTEVQLINNLHKDLVKIISICSKNGTCKVDYRKNYLDRYNTLTKNAQEIGITICSPILATPDTIRTEISSILKRYTSSDRKILKAINLMLEKEGIKNYKELPAKSKIDAHNKFYKVLKNLTKLKKD